MPRKCSFQLGGDQGGPELNAFNGRVPAGGWKKKPKGNGKGAEHGGDELTMLVWEPAALLPPANPARTQFDTAGGQAPALEDRRQLFQKWLQVLHCGLFTNAPQNPMTNTMIWLQVLRQVVASIYTQRPTP